ncbi:RNA polymerase sigma-70 factor [Chitinophaga sp. ARDCPP14]|uniref:RNA polymerase sigma-70 factor n=1 Tax=Chitinophaga sp. ARDCPP14 TaxID=3391139 RepID=UPI003F527241
MPSTTLYIAYPNAGDEQQMFTDLFRKHGAKIFFYFKKYVKREEIAEDLLQEVFASLWSKRDRLQQEKNITAYLFVSARNQLYNHLKLAVATATTTLPEDTLPLSYEHVEEAIRYKETKATYYEALSTLPPQRRKAFILSREKGLSYQEIATEMGISPRTVEKHVSATLHLLRDKMNDPYVLCLLFIIW